MKINKGLGIIVLLLLQGGGNIQRGGGGEMGAAFDKEVASLAFLLLLPLLHAL